MLQTRSDIAMQYLNLTRTSNAYYLRECLRPISERQTALRLIALCISTSITKTFSDWCLTQL